MMGYWELWDMYGEGLGFWGTGCGATVIVCGASPDE